MTKPELIASFALNIIWVRMPKSDEFLYVSGNKDEAKAVFEKALNSFPENEKVKETMRRFKP